MPPDDDQLIFFGDDSTVDISLEKESKRRITGVGNSPLWVFLEKPSFVCQTTTLSTSIDILYKNNDVGKRVATGVEVVYTHTIVTQYRIRNNSAHDPVPTIYIDHSVCFRRKEMDWSSLCALDGDKIRRAFIEWWVGTDGYSEREEWNQESRHWRKLPVMLICKPIPGQQRTRWVCHTKQGWFLCKSHCWIYSFPIFIRCWWWLAVRTVRRFPKPSLEERMYSVTEVALTRKQMTTRKSLVSFLDSAQSLLSKSRIETCRRLVAHYILC